MLVNSWIIFKFLNSIVPLYSTTSDQLLNASIFAVRIHPGWVTKYIFAFTFLPPALMFLVSKFFSLSYESYRKKEEFVWFDSYGWCKHLTGRVISKIAVNFMAEQTAHDETKTALMVDILDFKDSLYSGIYSDYYMEDGKLASIAISNVIRFSFKGETERKAIKGRGGSEERPYILPNQGAMSFPVTQIQNFHFWTIKHGRRFEKSLERPQDQVLIAWYLVLQYALPWLKLKVCAVVPAEDVDVTPLGRELEKLHIDLTGLEIKEPPMGNADSDSPAQHDTPPSH